MNKLFSTRSLNGQLYRNVLLSLLVAALVFTTSYQLVQLLLDKTVYGVPFATQMEKRYAESLQNYIAEKQITADSVSQLHVWHTKTEKINLAVYYQGEPIYISPYGNTKEPDLEDFHITMEDMNYEYLLTFSDGTPIQAFLYYYAGDAYYYLCIVLSGVLAFLAFSLVFISFVQRKLRYVAQLKKELDILAGGDLSYPMTVQGEDELGELASGIDQMRQSILAHQQSEDAIRSANSQLVTAMSHDLRTPLTSLLAYLELLERGKYQDEAQLKHFISRSLEKTLNIKTLADQLFEYFLVYSSEWEQPDLEAVDGALLLEQAWSEYAFSLENQGFRVDLDLSEASGSLKVDHDMLRRAFDNLYSNLLKYADSAHPLKIRSGRNADHILLTIENAVAEQKQSCESTHIGLITCQRILQYHGGSFETCAEDGRFSVTMKLPVIEIPGA